MSTDSLCLVSSYEILSWNLKPLLRGFNGCKNGKSLAITTLCFIYPVTIHWIWSEQWVDKWQAIPPFAAWKSMAMWSFCFWLFLQVAYLQINDLRCLKRKHVIDWVRWVLPAENWTALESMSNSQESSLVNKLHKNLPPLLLSNWVDISLNKGSTSNS